MGTTVTGRVARPAVSLAPHVPAMDNAVAPVADVRQRATGPIACGTLRKPTIAQQPEAKALQRELHDSVLQDVLYLALELTRLAGQKGAETRQCASESKRLAAVARDTYRQLRNVVETGWALPEPPGDLRRVVRRELAAFTRRTGAQATLTVRGGNTLIPLPRHVGYEVACILREALWNAWIHAHARRISVSVERQGGEATIGVADDGQGFIPAAVSEAHFGLRFMRARADAIGARIEVDSGPGTGTAVRLALEVQRSDRVDRRRS